MLTELFSIEDVYSREKYLQNLLVRARELGVHDEFLKNYKQTEQDLVELQRELNKEPKKKTRKLKKASKLMDKELDEPVVFVGVDEEIPLLVEGTCILSAKPKLGKSWLVLAMCIAISNGEDFLGYKTKRCSTLYLDLETSEQLQQKRLRKVLKDGKSVPDNFYLETETDNLDSGFIDQIEAYLKEDPEIGVIVIDVFQIIRSSMKNTKENEYEHAYRDITPLNELARKYHLSIILVCHDRKMVDLDDPFANILGSTGLQGAVSQMMVMFKPRRELPIHLSVKGKTIDGIVDLDIELNNGEWTTKTIESCEQAAMKNEYFESPIRTAVLSLADEGFNGRCSGIIQEAAKHGVGLELDAKAVGGFIHKHIGFFRNDGVLVEIIKNGSGGSSYRISKSTVDTVDGFYQSDGSNPW